MEVRVVFYGRLKADAGLSAQSLHLGEESATVRQVIDVVLAEHPSLAPLLDTVAYTVGATLVQPDAPVRDGDEVGLLPPVSGG